MSRKAQATIFMIIGLIIVIGGIFFFYLRQKTLETPIEQEAEEFKPEFEVQSQLKDYVDACIQQQVLQGLEIIRLQGGYINIPDDAITLTVKDKNNLQIKDVDGNKRVVVDANGEGNKVPYWLTKDSLDIPSLDLIKSELAGYVTGELGKCVKDFRPFREQRFNVTYGRIGTEVEMEKAVAVRVRFPISMERENIKFDISDFVYTLPIDMASIYALSSDLAVNEHFNAYLEGHAKDLISLYSGIDEKKLPPFSQSLTNFDCSSVSWSKASVKNMLKQIFEKNIPYIKIKNTDFIKIVSQNPSMQGVYDSFIYELFDTNFSGLSANFSYRPEWEFISYDIKPNFGDLLQPLRAMQNRVPLIPPICIFEYEFKYTIDMPVLAEVNSLSSALIKPESNVYFDGRGFNFQFAMDSFLCGNQERECTGRLNEGLSANAAGPDVPALPKTLFCSEEQKTSEEITITTLDWSTKQAIANIPVYYYCGSDNNNCFMGQTDAAGTLTTKFPKCINGFIHMYKQGYGQLAELLTVYNEPARAIAYEIDRLKEVSIELKKIYIPDYVKNYYETRDLSFGNSIRDLSPGENAIMSILGPQQNIYFYPDPESRKIELGSGSFSLNIVLNGNVSIQPKQIQGQTLNGFKGKQIFGVTNLGWNIAKGRVKDKVTFFALSDFDSSNLNPGTWDDILDPILRDDGNLSAELLYQCNRNPADDSCIYASCSFVAIDGTNSMDFAVAEDSCQKVERIEITKEQYLQFIQPQFS